MRRRLRAAISAGWWDVLARLGLSRERWSALPTTARRAVKALIWTGISLLLVAFLGVWQWSALGIAAVVLVLVVPRYGGVTIRGWKVGKYLMPLAALAIAFTYPFYAYNADGVSPGLPQIGRAHV